MKRITFTYHMNSRKETAETCIAINVSDELLKSKNRNDLEGALDELSHELAMLAGYDSGSFCCIDKVEG